MSTLSILAVFWVGAVFGAAVGIFAMSVLQINRSTDANWQPARKQPKWSKS